MNLLEEEVKSQSQNQNNNIIKMAIAAIVVLVIIAIAVFSYSKYLQSKQFKFVLNSESKRITAGLFDFSEDELLISVSDFAGLVNYEFSKGQYKKYDEDINKCYVKNADEVAGLEVNSNSVYKMVLADNEYEYYKLKSKPKLINGKIYTTIEGISLLFNVQMKYSAESNKVIVQTLDTIVSKNYIANNTSTSNNNNGILEKDVLFSNKKALKYGYLLVKNADNEIGVYDLNTKNEIIGKKYTSVKFMESTKDFIVTTPENKQGIKSAIDNVELTPQYDEIKQLDVDNDLYIVKSNDKYGVINRKSGKYIIYAEYDSIGIDSENFEKDEIINPYILYDNCIPVKKIIETEDEDKRVNKKEEWTLFNKEGKKINQNTYDSLGYIKGTAKTSRGNNLLLIPDVEGIVVYKNSKYGLINSVGRELIPVSLKDIYSITNEGKNTYYMVYGNNNTTENILEYLDKKANSTNENNTNNTNSNSTNIVNNTTNNTVVNPSNNNTNNTTNNTTIKPSNNITNNTANNTVINQANNVTNNTVVKNNTSAGQINNQNTI